MAIKTLFNERFILPFAMISFGLISILFGKELCWDLANYHYYNPYAFIHGRTAIDYWPSSFIQQYLNPAMDLITYFLINNFSPLMTEFLLGAIHGINLWLLFLIARLFTTGNLKTMMAFMLALFGVYGPVTLPSIGSFQNDNIVSIFVLGFIFFQLKLLTTHLTLDKISSRLIFISGALLGSAVGLKLTAAVFILGGLFSLSILPISLWLRFRIVILFIISIIIGICLTSGYWMYFMWQQHANPVFPFLNNIFHSPDFVASNWRDTRFLPHGILQHLFFPFYFSWDGRTSDVYFRDFRFMVIYLLLAAAGVKFLFGKLFHLSPEKRPLIEIWLFYFFVFSYIVWQSYFSIARYILVLELLSPLLIFLLLKSFIKSSHTLNKAAFLILGILSLLMEPVPFIRSTDYQGTFFNPHIPSSLEKIHRAVVLISYPAYAVNPDPRPQSYLIPYFPSDWQFVGIPFLNNNYLDEKSTIKKVQEFLSKAPSHIYLLTTKRNILKFQQVAHYFGLTDDGTCFIITSDRQRIAHQMVMLCPFKLIKPAYLNMNNASSEHS